MADQISICNMALSEIVAKAIQSLDERSVEAEMCGRYYDQSLKSLLESHPWGFATRRALLAPIVNPRPGQWTAAFAMPVDVARPIKIMSAAQISGSTSWWIDDDLSGVPYAIEDETLFAGVPDPVFAYVSSSINAAALSSKFVDALVLDLASRIVMPIKKSREMKGDLIKQAEIAKDRAMADDTNRQPDADGWVEQVQAARDGWSGRCFGRASSAQSMYDVVAAPTPTVPPVIVEDQWVTRQW